MSVWVLKSRAGATLSNRSPDQRYRHGLQEASIRQKVNAIPFQRYQAPTAELPRIGKIDVKCSIRASLGVTV